MDPLIHPIDAVEEDHPIPLIHRRRVLGDRMMFAKVRLDKGCQVAPHSHESEQIAFVYSGRVRWHLGAEGTPEYRQVVTEGGNVVVLPSNFVHGVEALEDTVIYDMLSPVGEMGIDRQNSIDVHSG